MAKSSTLSATLILILAAAMIFGAASAASPVGAPGPSPPGSAAPAPGPAGPDCFAYLLNVSDCLSYVQQGSNLTKPEKPCCPEVKKLLQEQPVCLCELLAHPDQSPIPIDLPKAKGLPSVCKLDLPFGTPASGCAALGVPIGGSPAPAPNAPAPSSGGTLPPAGLASSPGSPSNAANDGIAASQRHFFFGLGIVLFVSFF